MKKERTLLILGIWTATLPFLGFPRSWKEVFFVLTGLGLVYMAYLFYLETTRRISKEKEESAAFVDNIGSRL